MSAGHHEKGITVISANKKWAAFAASAVMGLAVIAPSMPAQAAEGKPTKGERVMVLKGATLRENIQMQYRVQVTSVKNGIVKGVEQWRLCSEHADACKKNEKGGDGWIGKGPVILTKSPIGGGFTGFSQVGELVATFQGDGSMKVSYRLDLDRLADKAGRQALRRFPICSSDPTCYAQLT